MASQLLAVNSRSRDQTAGARAGLATACTRQRSEAGLTSAGPLGPQENMLAAHRRAGGYACADASESHTGRIPVPGTA